MPREGWDDEQIMFLVRDLALMDSNNFVDNVGVGEREGRVFSNIVKQKYFSMAHGVGRSGDLTAEQVWKSMWISFSPSIPPPELFVSIHSCCLPFPFLSNSCCDAISSLRSPLPPSRV